MEEFEKRDSFVSESVMDVSISSFSQIKVESIGDAVLIENTEMQELLSMLKSIR